MRSTKPLVSARSAAKMLLLCGLALFDFTSKFRASGQSLIDRLADGKIRASLVPGLRVAYLPIIFPSSHASNLLVLSNGDLLCAYYSGEWEGQSGTAIVISRLVKGSHGWSRPAVIARETGKAFENPVLFESAGMLWLFYTAQAADAGQSEAQIFTRTSADAGQTWTAAKVAFSKAGSFDREPLVVADGQWLFPIYYTPKSDAENYSAVEISHDKGQSWRECQVPGSNGLVQPDVVELSPRRLKAFLRSRFADWVYTSNSQDGCTWTTPEPTQIPNNNSSIQVTRLRDGHLLMAFNNIQATTTRGKPLDTARWPLSVALSTDEGRTWPWVRDVDIGQEVPQEAVPDTMAGTDVRDEKKSFFYHLIDYSYPSVVQTPDGAVHMSYTYRRRTIKYASFEENWVRNGTTLGFFPGDRQ